MKRERKAGLYDFPDANGRIYWRARIGLEIGRAWVDVSDDARYDERKARREADEMQARENREHAIFLGRQAAKRKVEPTDSTDETASAWMDRFTKARSGLKAAAKNQRMWQRWIHPIVGDKPMVQLTSDDVEDVRDRLDAALASGQIMGATARNVWSVMTSACRAATTSKVRNLRVLKSNPAKDVDPPERGKARVKTYLFPIEVDQLLACPAVPVRMRQLYAFAAYTGLRPGELAAVTWNDVDFDARFVRVQRSWDWHTRTMGPPKYDSFRNVPIPETLVAMLEAMKGEPGEYVAGDYKDAWGKNEAPERLRRHLALAGVNRPRLTERTAATLPINFRSFRETNLTHLALAGVDALKIQRRAGHRGFSQTSSYLKEAEDLSGGKIGTPFSALPAKLLAKCEDSGDKNEETPVFAGVSVCEGGDLNPYDVTR